MQNSKSISVNASLVLALMVTCAFLWVHTLSALPPRPTYPDETTQSLRQLRDAVGDLQHEVHNHEAELRVFEEKISNQENIVDSLRQQMMDSHEGHKEFLKGTASTIDHKLASLEVLSKGFQNEIKPLKTHANDTSSLLTQLKQDLGGLKRQVDEQNRTIDDLQMALKSIMEALQIPVPASSSSSKTYKVKTGDSLEKIAKNYRVSVRAIKEENGLTQDKIVIGQTLKIPGSSS